jgi:putative toxin-antitoxin system antitoxin component (TIGR02293 family)
MSAVIDTNLDAPTYARRVAALLGVARLIDRVGQSQVGIHEVLQAGLPRRALLRAIDAVDIASAELLPVFGISTRTFMRIKADPDGRLDAELSARVWRFTELLAKAEDVFGGSGRAARWMLDPAMALEHRRPIDLMTTSIGARLVEDVIERIRYGVYQ